MPAKKNSEINYFYKEGGGKFSYINDMTIIEKVYFVYVIVMLTSEGGTWLGMDEKGRLAVLTNVYTGKPIKSAGRGFLVIDYLNGDKSAMQYMSDLSNNNSKYSPFNLCIFEPRDNGYEAVYFKNTFKDNASGIVIQGTGPTFLSPGISGFGNHPLSEPYRKTAYGIEEFKKIIGRNLDSNLVEEEAVNLLNNKLQMYPDDQMQKQSGVFQKSDKEPQNPDSFRYQSDVEGPDESEETKLMLQKEKLLSAIFVDIGELYGTRMQTIILVDFNHNVKFVERTRASNTSPYKWNIKRFDFKF